MASSLISNPATNTTNRSRDSHRNKKKKKDQQKHHHHQQEEEEEDQSLPKWKSQSQQQIYSSKLRQALARVNLGSSGSADAPRRRKAVREAADRVLADAAKGRTRWSRAILMNRLKLKFRKQHKRQRVTPTGSARSKKPRVSVFRLKGKTLPAFQRKVRVLGRLVPGCRKEPFPVILEEAIDYIPALEMQVRAMSAVVDLIFGSPSSSGAGSSSGSAPPS